HTLGDAGCICIWEGRSGVPSPYPLPRSGRGEKRAAFGGVACYGRRRRPRTHRGVFMGLIGGLRRRNVIRLAGLYLGGAWLIVQVSSTVLPMFDAPAWLPRSIVILLAIGFVPALIFSWIFELTPEGIKRDADVPLEQSISAQTAERMNRM